MSKELDTFKKIKTEWDSEGYLLKDWMDDNDIDIVEKGLKRLEAIDNSNPSKALECLDRLDNTLCLNNIEGKLEFGIDTEEHTDCDNVIGMTEDLETIKNALLKQQEPKKYLRWENLTFSKETTYVKATLNGVVVTLACWVDNSKEWCRVDFDNAPCNNMVFVHHGYNDDTDTQQLLFDDLEFVEVSE